MTMRLSPELRATLLTARSRCESPFFLYDLPSISRNLERLSAEGVRFWYACKANPLGAILERVVKRGFGFDVASLGELQQAKKFAGASTRILTTGPAKSKEFIKAALAAGVDTFVLESPSQYRSLLDATRSCGRNVDALLRLQIDAGEAGKSVLGGDQITAFGCGLEDWLAAELPVEPQVRIRGVHIFQWGNIRDAARLEKIWLVYAQAATTLADRLGFTLNILDLGGGLGIPYAQAEKKLEWPSVVTALSNLRQRVRSAEIWLELGRYAVGEYGYYVATVVDRKQVRGRAILVLDGGMNHLLRPSLVQEPFPAELLRESNAPRQAFQVHGPLCTALDCLGSLELAADVQAGDALVFQQCGAYGFTESMPYFLCHTGAAEFVYEENALLRLIREPLKPEAWMR